MNPPALAASLALACLFASPLRAEQQVTLKTGATLVGKVTFDGDAIVVDVGGATNRVPMADVASVATADFGAKEQARRLLLSALESQVWGGTPREAAALLSEAARLAPDDPQIAFWYANALVDAGFGKAASRTFEAHRAAIEDAFPQRVDALAERIELRTTVEMLPRQMVQRIDDFNAAADLRPPNAGITPMAVVFRVIDQFKDPIEPEAIQINANGGDDEQLEKFTDGYCLFTYARRRDNGDQPCNLNVSLYGLKPLQQQFRAGDDQVAIAGEFTVHRFVEGDARPIRFVVADRDGKPIRAVSIQLNPSMNTQGRTVALSGSTDDEGRAAIHAFPGSYGYSATAMGFNADNGPVELSVDAAEGVERSLTLYRAIPATVRFSYSTRPLMAGGLQNTNGEATLRLNAGPAGPIPYGQDMAQWVRPLQVESRLVLQISHYPYGPQMPGTTGPWFRKLVADADGSDADGDADERKRTAEKHFDAVDLKDVDKLGDEFKPVEIVGMQPGFGQPVRLEAEFGDVVVGKTIARDLRTGQPIELIFKALVEQPAGD